MIIRAGIFIAVAFALATPTAFGQAAFPQSESGRLVVNASLDANNPDEIILRSEEAPLDQVLAMMSEQLDFTFRNRTGQALEQPVSVHVSGRSEDIIRWLLREFNFAIGRREDDMTVVERVVVLSRLDQPGVQPTAIQLRYGDLVALEAELDGTANANLDYREWLEQLIANQRGEMVSNDAVVNLYDTPTSLAERMERRIAPLSGDYDTFRLENRDNGAPPRHLTRGNDAAQHDIESALARTTALAIEGVRDLRDALENICEGGICQNSEGNGE